MKKRLLTLVLTLLAVVGSTAVSYAANWPIKIKGIQITDENSSDPLGNGLVEVYENWWYFGYFAPEFKDGYMFVLIRPKADGGKYEIDCEDASFVEYTGTGKGVIVDFLLNDCEFSIKSNKTLISSTGDVVVTAPSQDSDKGYMRTTHTVKFYSTNGNVIEAGKDVHLRQLKDGSELISKNGVAISARGSLNSLNCDVKLKGYSMAAIGVYDFVPWKCGTRSAFLYDRDYNLANVQAGGIYAKGKALNEVYLQYEEPDLGHMYNDQIFIGGHRCTLMNADDVLGDGSKITHRYTKRFVERGFPYLSYVWQDTCIITMDNVKIEMSNYPAIYNQSDSTATVVYYSGKCELSTVSTNTFDALSLVASSTGTVSHQPTNPKSIIFRSLNGGTQDTLIITSSYNAGCVMGQDVRFEGGGVVDLRVNNVNTASNVGTYVIANCEYLKVGSSLRMHALPGNKGKNGAFFSYSYVPSFYCDYGIYKPYTYDGTSQDMRGGTFYSSVNTSDRTYDDVIFSRVRPTSYGITVCGTPLNSFNCDDVVPGLTYNSGREILTLDNVKIDYLKGTAISFSAGIYPRIFLKGENKIYASTYGIGTSSDLEIYGSGSLTMTGSPNANINLNGANLTVNGVPNLTLKNANYGIRGTGSETVTFKSSTVTVTPKTSAFNGVDVKLIGCAYNSYVSAPNTVIYATDIYNILIGGASGERIDSKHTGDVMGDGSVRFEYNTDGPSVLYLYNANLPKINYYTKNASGSYLPLTTGLRIEYKGKCSIAGIERLGSVDAPLIINGDEASRSSIRFTAPVRNSADITLSGIYDVAFEIDKGSYPCLSSTYLTLKSGVNGTVSFNNTAGGVAVHANVLNLYNGFYVCLPQSGHPDSSTGNIVDKDGNTASEVYITNSTSGVIALNGRMVSPRNYGDPLGNGKVQYSPVTGTLSLSLGHNINNIESYRPLTIETNNNITIESQNGPCVEMMMGDSLTLRSAIGGDEINFICNDEESAAIVCCGLSLMKNKKKGGMHNTINIKSKGYGLNLMDGPLHQSNCNVFIDRTGKGAIVGLGPVELGYHPYYPDHIYGPWGTLDETQVQLNSYLMPRYHALTDLEGNLYRGKVVIAQGLGKTSVSVGGVQVTELNYDDVLGDGTVSMANPNDPEEWDVNHLYVKNAKVLTENTYAINLFGYPVPEIVFEGYNEFISQEYPAIACIGKLTLQSKGDNPIFNVLSSKSDGILLAGERMRIDGGMSVITGKTSAVFARDKEAQFDVFGADTHCAFVCTDSENGYGNVIGFGEMYLVKELQMAASDGSEVNFVPGRGVCDANDDLFLGVNPFLLIAPKDEIDGINSAASALSQADGATKMLKDGKILIIRNGKTYNTSGVEVK